MTLDESVAQFAPDRLTVSGKFTAVLACLFGGHPWTEPAIAELAVTCDGFLLARQEGEIGHNDIIGSFDDLVRNMRGVLEAVGVEGEARAKLLALADSNLVTFGPYTLAAAV